MFVAELRSRTPKTLAFVSSVAWKQARFCGNMSLFNWLLFLLLLLAPSIFWNDQRFAVNAGCGKTKEEPGKVCNIYYSQFITKKGRLKVVCRGKSVTKIPNVFPINTAILYLNKNKIKGLDIKDLKGCGELRELQLNHNHLSYIASYTFQSTPKLRKLSLHGNSIILSTLPADAFAGLNKLQVLCVKGNNWNESTSYNGPLFTRMLNLETLRIDGTPGVKFPIEFKNLSKLTHLSIYGGLQYITNKTFENFNNSSVTDLMIESDLRHLEPNSFSHFTSLTKLSLIGNQNLGLENASDAWYGLKNTKIQQLKLQSFLDDNGGSAEVGPQSLKFLDQLNLAELDLSRNGIFRFKVNLSSALPRVEKLYLAQNRLGYTQALADDLARMKTLAILDVSRQFCPVLSNELPQPSETEETEEENDSEPTDSDDDLEQVENQLNTWPNPFGSCVTRRRRNCSETNSMLPLAQLNTDRRKTAEPVCFTIGRKLKNVYLTEAVRMASRAIEQVVISGGGSLQKVYMGSSGLTKIFGPVIFEQPVKRLTVYLNDNQISCLATDVFCASQKSGSSIFELNLAGNRLAEQLMKDVNGDTFQCLISLKNLNLSRNGIKTLPQQVFQHLTSLEYLDLSQNAIRVVEFEFAHMTNLKLFDLSNSLITFMNETLTLTFTKLFNASKQFKLNLGGNPLQCSCETLSFLTWLQSYNEQLYGFERYSCFYSNEIVTFDKLSNYILIELEYDCDKRIAVIVSGVLLIVALVSVAMSAFCYRHRWEIRYSCLKLTRQGKRYQQIVSQAAHHEYDAFVVYDSEDRQWVHTELVPKLEQPRPCLNADETDGFPVGASLRLCIHERDFRPGEPILSNIYDKLERSRKVVLIVSKNFVKSKYCDYEMNLAKLLSVEQSRDVLVPVLLELPDVDSVSSTLHRVLRTVTYLEWPCCEGEREDFWVNLRAAIGTSYQ